MFVKNPNLGADPNLGDFTVYMCEIITMVYNNGVSPRVRSHPKYCEESPQILRGVTPNAARSHPKCCEESPQMLLGVTPNAARSHPKYCEESP